MKAALMPLVERTIRRNRVVLKVAGKATAMLRNLSLKPYAPKRRTREFAAAHGLPSLHAVRTSIFREKGEGTIPTIVIAGFVPDATEVIEFQRPLLKEFGTIYYLNYPRTGFSLSLFFAQLADLVEEINRQGERPVLFGHSDGGSIALLFALFRTKPSPFCILDEVDAPLDEVNVGRLSQLLKEMAAQTQFIVITHAKKTMETAEMLYGVTMQEQGVSKLVSVKLQAPPPPPQARIQTEARA